MIEFLGKGRLQELKRLAEEQGAKRIFLVTGKAAYEKSGLRQRVESLLVGKELCRFADYEPNPKYEDLVLGIEQAEAFAPDLIIAVGGGSVLDMAKLLSVLSGHEDAALDIIQGRAPVPERKIPLILIPTTAGSGSECTHFAVIYVDGVKYSVASPSLLPDAAIIDPELTHSAPPGLTAVTAFDALAQAIESYWSVASTEESRGYASSSIRGIMGIIDKLLTHPDAHAREEMMLAAHLAGKAINITKTTAAHALSYGFTIRHGVPHGHAVMLTLPELFMRNAQATTHSLNQGISIVEHQKRMTELCVLLGAADPTEAAERLRALMRTSGLALRLRDIGVSTPEEAATLAREVNIERLNNNPVRLEHRELEEMLASLI